ncbi:MAG: S9 family peptidase [Fimbriimonadaceae bacterium]|nr:S9 family peptidase [Fimbriimonadaceae bacterium]
MSKRAMTPEDLLRLVFVGDAQIRPGGQDVLFQRKTIVRNRYVGQLWLVDFEGNARQLTYGDSSAGHGRWSPDGESVFFIAKRGEAAQVFRLSLHGGEAFPITALPEGSLGGFRLSPTGSHLALTFREPMPGDTAADKKQREADQLSQPPVEIDSVQYRLDGDGYFANQRYRLQIYAMGVGDEKATLVREYTDAVDGQYSYSWHPAGDRLAVVHSASVQPVIGMPNDHVYVVPIDGEPSLLGPIPADQPRGGEKSEPRWSPDGTRLAFAGNTDPVDPWGVKNTHLYVVDADGSNLVDLTGGQDFDFSVATLSDTAEAAFGARYEWAPDGSGLYAQIGTRGETQLGFVTVAGGVELLTSGHHALQITSIEGDRLAGTLSTPTQLPEVVVVTRELGTGQWVPKQLTAFNQAFQDEVEILEPQEFFAPSTDGTQVHGWAIVPKAGRLPVALNIHGGPHAQYGWTFFHEMQVFAAAGYAVVYSNPRGSKGYGEAFCAAIRGDWGNKDWDDIQAVTAWISAQPWADAERIGIMGGSYGGYMTNWAIGHSKAYRCAITDRCVSNMVSMAGNSDFPFNKDGYFRGVAWGDLDDIRELWRQSPIAWFQNVTTPTLVIHSEGDLRCNVEQSDQVFTALQMQGVPSRYVRYPSTTSHGMSRNGPPDLRLHRQREYLNWMAKWLSG